jgi:hypothetical protein
MGLPTSLAFWCHGGWPHRLRFLAFVVAGVTTFLDDIAWRTLALSATLASLALTVLGWPYSRIGLALNLLLLVYLLLGAKLGWLPSRIT